MEVSRDLKISIVTEGKEKKTRQKREREYKEKKENMHKKKHNTFGPHFLVVWEVNLGRE